MCIYRYIYIYIYTYMPLLVQLGVPSPAGGLRDEELDARPEGGRC